MDLYYRDQEVFASEYQNAPMSLADQNPYLLEGQTLARRISGYKRGVVPDDTD